MVEQEKQIEIEKKADEQGKYQQTMRNEFVEYYKISMKTIRVAEKGRNCKKIDQQV